MRLDIAVVVLVTMLLGMIMTIAVRRRQRSHGDEAEVTGLGARVLVAVGRPRSAGHLTGIGAAVASPEQGVVLPVTVLIDPDEADRNGARRALQDADRAAGDHDVEVEAAIRVDASVVDGILHSVVERDATLVVVGWPATEHGGPAGDPVGRIVAHVPAPVLVARLEAERWSRVVLRMPEPTTQPEQASVRLALAALTRVARACGVPPVSAVPVEALGDAVGGDEITVVPVGGPSLFDELTVVPVSPDARALRRAVEEVTTPGDVILALAHGHEAERRRALLGSAAALVDGPSSDDPHKD